MPSLPAFSVPAAPAPAEVDAEPESATFEVVAPLEPPASDTARCPAEMASIDDRYCIDRWEASLVEWWPNRDEEPWSPFVVLGGQTGRLRAVSGRGVFPQAYISEQQALAACEASGKRLCSAGEWIRACRGPRRTLFPYGPERRAHVCNDDIRPVHPIVELGEKLGIPKEHWWGDFMNDPGLNQLENSLLPTGERSGCTNEYGVYDMVGNLHEWVDDPAGTFLGGFYMDTTINGDGCEYVTDAHNVRYHDYSTGFRCCMDIDPVE